MVAFCTLFASMPLKSEILSYNYFELGLGFHNGSELERFIDIDIYSLNLQGGFYINEIESSLPDYFFIQGGLGHVNSSIKATGTKAHMLFGYDQYLNNRSSLWVGFGAIYQAYQYILFQRELLNVQIEDSRTESILSNWNMTHVINARDFSHTLRTGIRYQANQDIELASSFRFNGGGLERFGYSLDIKYNTIYDFYILGRFDRAEEVSGIIFGAGKLF